MQRLYKHIFIVGALLLTGGLAHAQSVAPDPVQYIVAPETPGPNQLVVIEAQGIGSFLGDATITWTQGGKVVKTGVGERTFSFTTGPLGSQTRVQARIVSPSQGTLVRDFVFVPSLVNLVWEADTSTPPFYRGKALYSAGSALTVVAFPTVVVNGSRASSNVLSFQWFRNGTPMPSQSGSGRNTFNFVGDQLQAQENVAVDVYYTGIKVGRGEVSIPTQDSLVVLYNKDPLRGVLYDNALPIAIALNAREITVQAVPYFFSNSSLKNGLVSYVWKLNSNEVVGPESSKGILTLRQTGSGQGGATLEVALQNNDGDRLIQAADTAIQIVFGEEASGFSSLFGL